MKNMILSILTIVVIVSFVFVYTESNQLSKIDKETENLAGDALAIKFAQSYKYENPQICKAFCPSGFNAIMNKSCININNSCIGNVSCGRFINGTLMNITSGYCNMESQASLK